MTTLKVARKDASETGKVPKRFSMWICRQISRGRKERWQEKKDNRRRSLGMDAGENRFLGGSDPTLSGLSAAQRLRHRGSLPPKLPRRFPCSVAREVQADQPTDLNP